jgi:hypothetical protein
MAAELRIIQHTHDLLTWTLHHTGRFPRSHRHSLGNRIEGKLFLLLDDLVEAKYTADKAEILRRAGLHVERLRLLYRVAKDMGILPYKSHEHASRSLQEIGRQLGAWRRKVQQR